MKKVQEFRLKVFNTWVERDMRVGLGLCDMCVEGAGQELLKQRGEIRWHEKGGKQLQVVGLCWTGGNLA